MEVINSPRSEGRDDAVGAEAVETLLGGHCVLQHVQTDGTHELTVQRPRRHSDLQPVRYRLLQRGAMLWPPVETLRHIVVML